MSFSLTGAAYLLGFLALSLLTYRFFQYWRQKKNKLSQAFFFLTAVVSLFMFIVAIGGLFFANNLKILKLVAILSIFVQGFAFAAISYIIIYLKFPQFSPRLAFGIFLLLGQIATILTVIVPFQPYLDESGGINWDVQLIPSIFRTALFLSTFLPLIIIMAQHFKTSEDSTIKAKSFGLLLMFVFGILIAFFDFFLINILKLPAISSAIAVGILSVITFIIFFFTQKLHLPGKPKDEYQSSSSPKIEW